MSLERWARAIATCEHPPERRVRLLELPPTAQDGAHEPTDAALELFVRKFVRKTHAVTVLCLQCGARRVRTNVTGPGVHMVSEAPWTHGELVAGLLAVLEPAVSPGLEHAAQIARLLRTWTAGDRLRAAMPIYYANGHPDVPEGHEGRVESVDPSHVLRIVWDELTPKGGAVATSPDAVDPTAIGNLDALRLELRRIVEVLDAGGIVDAVRLHFANALDGAGYIRIGAPHHSSAFGVPGAVSVTPLGREAAEGVHVLPLIAAGLCVHCARPREAHGAPWRADEAERLGFIPQGERPCPEYALRQLRPDFPRPGERWPWFVAVGAAATARGEGGR